MLATPTPESAPVELDPAVAAHVRDVMAALRRLDHHLRGRIGSERHVGLSRATGATHDGVSQMLATSAFHATARPDAEEVSR